MMNCLIDLRSDWIPILDRCILTTCPITMWAAYTHRNEQKLILCEMKLCCNECEIEVEYGQTRTVHSPHLCSPLEKCWYVLQSSMTRNYLLQILFEYHFLPSKPPCTSKYSIFRRSLWVTELWVNVACLNHCDTDVIIQDCFWNCSDLFIN